MSPFFIVFAMAAAACFATSSVAQHRAASTLVVDGSGLRLAVRLAAHPLWLLGLLAGGLGFLLQALALARGPLVVVQLLLVSGLLLALPAAVIVERRRPQLREWLWAAAVAAGLLAFLGGSRPAPGVALAHPMELAVGSACCAGAVVIAALLARPAGARYTALLLGLGGGAALGLASALLKQVVGEVGRGLGHPLVHWPLYALLVAGAGGIALTQASYRAGVLAASQPAITIAEPLAAAVLGALAFHETLAHSAGALTLQAVGVVVMIIGVVGLARVAQSLDHASSPSAPPAAHPSSPRPISSTPPNAQRSALPADEDSAPAASRPASLQEDLC